MTEIASAGWGNSAAIRLPKALMQELGLKQGQKIPVTVKDGKGILQPVPEPPTRITLEWIVAETIRLGPGKEPKSAADEYDDEYRRQVLMDDDGGFDGR